MSINSLLLYLVSVMIAGVSGYVFGSNLVYGHYDLSITGLTAMISSCWVANMSQKDLRKSLDKWLVKRDNEIER